jgi:hypothetical protein
MPQHQHVVRLILLDGNQDVAAATGNNAAWHCKCGRSRPLIGRSSGKTDPSEGFRIDCPDCSRSYFVVPEDKDFGKVLEVREVEKGGLA